jgi:translation initiation factor IF-3
MEVKLSCKLNDERWTWEKNQFKKKFEKKPKSTQINSFNLWPKIWDQDIPQKEKRKNSWSSRPNNLMSKDEIKKKIN